MPARLLALLLFFASPLLAAAQADCPLRITLLTCAPGAELYSTFGHTALRVQNVQTGEDRVYNYGTFEFGEDFYVKFVRGKLPYFLSIERYDDFIYQYQMESRSVWEQEVLLDCTRRAALLRALDENALPQNRQYRYDFLFDNCTTRAGDMILRQAPAPVTTARVIPEAADKAPTFRNLIHRYLDSGQQHWSKLGIDLLLGAKLDRRVTNREAQFLPEILLQGMTGARGADSLIVSAARPVLQLPRPADGGGIPRPGIVFGALLAVVTVLSFMPRRGVRGFIRAFDFLLFFSTGAVGVLLLFMWFGTDHQLCANNWNLLWALPTNLLAAPFVRRDSRPMHWYLGATIALNALALIGWIFLPQQLNTGFLPVVLLLLLRAWLIILKPHYHAPEADRT
ncbi:DUF4105 domain-containing protein [Flaviaesturariibacter amylovorans]|uniref:Lnb N-terminal periplasmic domain-containing protein n=1 Tax=Flaviaesturariibacter amylovorans TaxID=1084520 RepID=UPI0031E57D31